MATATQREKVFGDIKSIENALDVTPEEIGATEATVKRVRDLYGNEQRGQQPPPSSRPTILRMVAHDLVGELY
jgi:hypothetical protein